MKLRPPFSLQKAWIVFVDQPLGTGLSHVDPACAWCDVVLCICSGFLFALCAAHVGLCAVVVGQWACSGYQRPFCYAVVC